MRNHASPKLLIFGSSVAKGWNGGGPETNGSFQFGFAGRLTPVLESTGWIVTNGSIGGNNTTLLNNRYDTDAVPVNPDVILIGLSLGNEGLLGDPDIAFESFRSGMTNLIHRSRTNGFYPVITHAYAHTAYDTNRYAYVKRMNLLLNSWNVPGINLLGPVDDGVGKWVTAYRSDDAHPNTAGHEEMLLRHRADAVRRHPGRSHQLRRNWPAHTDLPACREQMPGRSPSPRRSTMHSFNSAFRVRAGYTGTVAAVMTATSAPPSRLPRHLPGRLRAPR
jgi:lysophospholipase L1-like esterase